MAEPEKNSLGEPKDRPSSWKASFSLRRRVGMSVALWLAFLVAGGMVWWNWEHIAKRREALKERTATQNDLGTALMRLGERESGTGKLEEAAVVAYRAALEERTRERVPLDWAITQNNLGNALERLGERESGTARLEEAVAAYREALKEWTRVRAPLQWAMTQMNLGNALQALGSRESGTGKLEEAVAAYREALKEWTAQTDPTNYQLTMKNLNQGLTLLKKKSRKKRSVH